MVTWSNAHNQLSARPLVHRLTRACFLICAAIVCLGLTNSADSTTGTPSSVESNVAGLFKAGDYAAVTTLFQVLPPEATPSINSYASRY